MYKTIAITILSVGYLWFMYSFFWIKTDNVHEIQRLNHYVGQVDKFECLMGGRKRLHPIIYLTIDTGEKIDFYYPKVRNCDNVRWRHPKPEGLNFDGYFMARGVMQLTLGDVLLYDFYSEKKSTNRFIFGVMVLPFFIALAIYFGKKTKLKEWAEQIWLGKNN